MNPAGFEQLRRPFCGQARAWWTKFGNRPRQFGDVVESILTLLFETFHDRCLERGRYVLAKLRERRRRVHRDTQDQLVENVGVPRGLSSQ